MRTISTLPIVCALALSAFAGSGTAQDSPTLQLFSIRSGETLPLRTLTWINRITCEPLFLDFEKFDVLEGPPELSLQFEPGQVHASTTRECPKPVKGGTILVTAKDVTEKKEGVFTFRAHMRTDEGPRLATYRYKMLLFPAGEPHGDVPSTRQHAEDLATKASKRFDDVVEARQLVEIKEAKEPEAADNAVGSARGMAGEMRHHRKRKKFGSRPKAREAYSLPRQEVKKGLCFETPAGYATRVVPCK